MTPVIFYKEQAKKNPPKIIHEKNQPTCSIKWLLNVINSSNVSFLRVFRVI